MGEKLIFELNKLIAEFFGFKVAAKQVMGDTRVYYDTSKLLGYNSQHPEDYFNFHNSWDWLMPVVEKIETTSVNIPEKYRRGFLKDKNVSLISIDIFYDLRKEYNGWSHDIHFLGGCSIMGISKRFKTKIECMYDAVIEFIKWYNNEKESKS